MDIDVVVLVVSHFNDIIPRELWVAFGAWSIFRFKTFHDVVSTMSPDKFQALPVFHALIVCNTVTVSSLAFLELFSMQNELTNPTLKLIETEQVVLWK